MLSWRGESRLPRAEVPTREGVWTALQRPGRPRANLHSSIWVHCSPNGVGAGALSPQGPQVGSWLPHLVQFGPHLWWGSLHPPGVAATERKVVRS